MSDFVKLWFMTGDLKTFLQDSDKIVMTERRFSDLSYFDIIRIIAFLLFIFAPLFGTTYLKNQVIKQGYRISALQKKVMELEEEKANLLSTWLYLKNPENLERWARKLGFKKPTPENMIFLKVEKPEITKKEEGKSLIKSIRKFLEGKLIQKLTVFVDG